MNMKKKSFWRQGILALCLACMCFACGGGEKKAPLGPSKGLPGELLLIVDASLWKTSARDSLEDVLKGSVPGLSQHEPMFRMIRIFPENYSGQYAFEEKVQQDCGRRVAGTFRLYGEGAGRYR